MVTARATLRFTALAPLAFLLVLVAARTSGRAAVEDLGLWDEVFYLSAGLGLHAGHLPGAYWSPLYAGWYALLSFVDQDPAALFRWSWPALLVANFAAWWAYGTAARIGTTVLLGGALWIGVARVMDPGAPYVTLFASAFFGVTLALVQRSRSTRSALTVGAGAAGLLVFARPELIVAFALLVTALLVSLRRSASAGESTRRLALAVAPFVLLFGVVGSPLVAQRSMLAFGQHYALNVKEARGGDFDPWNEWKPVFAEAFGNAQTVAQAVQANPGEAAWHVAQNLKALVLEGLPLFSPRLTQSPSAVATPLETVTGAAIVMLLILGAGLLFREVSRLDGDPVKRQQSLGLTLVAGAFVVAELSGFLLVRPRPHHFAILAFALLAVGAAGHARWLARVSLGAAGWAVVTLALLVIPSRSGQFAWFLPSGDPPSTPALPDAAIVRELDRLAPPSSVVTLLEASYGHGFYAGWSVRSLTLAQCAAFGPCLAARPDVIVVDRLLSGFYERRKDSVFETFSQHPAAHGYATRQVPSTNVVLFVRDGFPGPAPDRR